MLEHMRISVWLKVSVLSHMPVLSRRKRKKEVLVQRVQAVFTRAFTPVQTPHHWHSIMFP